MTEPVRDAILLLGPTGSGKTPLGDHLERVGWSGRACRHLDFGARLRAVSVSPPGDWSPVDVGAVQTAVATGALLEDADVHIALRIIDDLVRPLPFETLVVLNGLPRHEGQAAAVATRVRVRGVLHLDASASCLQRRIRRNAGGERDGRTDDAEEAAIARRLHRFEARTRPLLAWYGARGTPLHRLEVGADTRAADLARALPPWALAPDAGRAPGEG